MELARHLQSLSVISSAYDLITYSDMHAICEIINEVGCGERITTFLRLVVAM